MVPKSYNKYLIFHIPFLITKIKWIKSIIYKYTIKGKIKCFTTSSYQQMFETELSEKLIMTHAMRTMHNYQTSECLFNKKPKVTSVKMKLTNNQEI